ncbi:hypothetical protein, partial [Shouchella miscanthi]|nr:hypothetical protein [Shouchella miscanthi]
LFCNKQPSKVNCSSVNTKCQGLSFKQGDSSGVSNNITVNRGANIFYGGYTSYASLFNIVMHVQTSTGTKVTGDLPVYYRGGENSATYKAAANGNYRISARCGDSSSQKRCAGYVSLNH